jgi:hypothetical protein
MRKQQQQQHCDLRGSGHCMHTSPAAAGLQGEVTTLLQQPAINLQVAAAQIC